ncbi:hypothetical protein LW977_17845, partial [Erwinia amylovora]|nr:hypothetical protein [Erwinia amylovora]
LRRAVVLRLRSLYGADIARPRHAGLSTEGMALTAAQRGIENRVSRISLEKASVRCTGRSHQR